MSEHEWDFEITNNGNQPITITTRLGHKQEIPGRTKYSGRYNGTEFVLDPIDGPPLRREWSVYDEIRNGKFVIRGGKFVETIKDPSSAQSH